MTLLHTCDCQSRRVYAADASPSRVDPTGTGRIRRRYESDVVRRFRRVKALARQAIVELDVFGFKRTSVSSQMTALSQRMTAPRVRRAVGDDYSPEQPRDDHGRWTSGFHGSPTSGIKEFSGEELFITQSESVAREYAKGSLMASARGQKKVEPTVYSVSVDPGNTLDLRRPDHREIYTRMRNEYNASVDDPDYKLPSLKSEGFLQSNHGVPGFGNATTILRLAEKYGFHSLLVSEGSQGYALVVRDPKNRVKVVHSFATGDAEPDLAEGAFQFERLADKVEKFMSWLRQMQREEILGVSEGPAYGGAANRAWQNVYIDSAYVKGLRDAVEELRGLEFASIGFNAPIHADRVALIYTRAYRDLEGITQAMDLKISRILAQAMAEGRGIGPPSFSKNGYDLAREISDAVEGIGVTRARVLARTEVIAAHAEAALNTYEEAGVQGVNADVEFQATDDERVCPECAGLSGRTYSIDDARGVIPVHPNCRCAWIPVLA